MTCMVRTGVWCSQGNASREHNKSADACRQKILRRGQINTNPEYTSHLCASQTRHIYEFCFEVARAREQQHTSTTARAAPQQNDTAKQKTGSKPLTTYSRLPYKYRVRPTPALYTAIPSRVQGMRQVCSHATAAAAAAINALVCVLQR